MELNDLGFDNVYQLSNFKRIKPLKKVELCYDTKPPYRLCTFSRVTEKKGIEDAIEAVCHVNEKARECIFTLDIYGPIDPDYADHFNTLSKTFPSYINYKGLVAHNSTVEVLRKYTLLLFPTKYSTEGIPGTIIDAFAAGVPVVASKWDNYSEIIEDNITGIGYEFNKLEDFKNKLDNVSLNINKLNFMKKNCIEAANNYLPELIIDNFIELLDRI
nr:glycosyltransferase [Marinilactibacillus kalidii]